MIAHTSIATYKDILNSGSISKQHYTILRFMDENKTYSRRELSKATGLEINAICGRVDELIKQGALVESQPRKDEITHRTIIPVKLNTGCGQDRLF